MRKIKGVILRVVPALLTAALTLAVLQGCGGGAETTQEPPEFGGVSLRVVTTYGPNDGGREAYLALCDEFSGSTGAAITDESEDSTEEWKQRVIASYQDGAGPDIAFFFTGPDVENLIGNGVFVSLDEIREEYPDYASNINLSVLESMKAEDGKGYAVPVKGYWERLFVNADIFEELNLPLPETYDDLFTLAPKLLEAGYIPIAASLSEVPHYLFEALLFNETGPSNHSIIPTDPDSPPDNWIAAMEQFTAMYEVGMFPAEADAPTHADAFELFQSKKAAMIIDGDWSVPYVDDPESVVVVNFPANPDSPRKNTDLISGFSMGFYISRAAWEDSAKRDAAVEFVRFMTSNASILRLNASGAAMPVSLTAEDIAQDEGADEATALRRSIDALNETTTAFVGATADNFRTEARSWLFGEILPLAKGEVGARDMLSEFIGMNNG